MILALHDYRALFIENNKSMRSRYIYRLRSIGVFMPKINKTIGECLKKNACKNNTGNCYPKN